MPLSILTVLLAPVQAAAAPAPVAIGGTIAVERSAAPARGPDPMRVFADAVETALTDAGFTAIPHVAHARQVATISVTRTPHGAALAKGASAGGALPMMGAGGGGVSIGLGAKTNVGEMMATELTIRITRRGQTVPSWEGRAVTYQVSGTRADDPAAIALKLSSALVRNFAAPSGLLVSVP